MTPLLLTAPQIRNHANVGANELAAPTTQAKLTVRRAQPVEKSHQPLFRMHGREASKGRARPTERALTLVAETTKKRVAQPSTGRLSPVAKFGDSAPALTQLIAHENGLLNAHMPKELSAFSRHMPNEAYQATLDRSRYIMRDISPLSAAA